MLGRAIAIQLQNSGVAVVSVGRSPKDDIHFDLNAKDRKVWSDERADVLFHCAASFAGNGEADFMRNFETNTSSAYDVISLAASLRAKMVIYAGTVFSNELDVENFNSYGLTKGLAESVMNWAARMSGIAFCSLRLSQLYDTEGQCCRHQPWFGRIVAYASRGLDIRMPRSLGPRNYLHIEDAAKAMISAAVSGHSGVFNSIHPQSMTLQEIAEVAYAIFAQGGRSISAGEKTPFRNIAFPSLTTNQLFGIKARTIQEGLLQIKNAGTSDAFGPMDVQ